MWSCSVGLMRTKMRHFRGLNSSYTSNFLRKLKTSRAYKYYTHTQKKKWKFYAKLPELYCKVCGWFTTFLPLGKTLLSLDVYKIHIKPCEDAFSLSARGFMHKAAAALGQTTNSLRCISSLQWWLLRKVNLRWTPELPFLTFIWGGGETICSSGELS